MKPSNEALAIDAAHKLYRESIGTDREDEMRENLESVVARVKRDAKGNRR